MLSGFLKSTQIIPCTRCLLCWAGWSESLFLDTFLLLSLICGSFNLMRICIRFILGEEVSRRSNDCMQHTSNRRLNSIAVFPQLLAVCPCFMGAVWNCRFPGEECNLFGIRFGSMKSQPTAEGVTKLNTPILGMSAELSIVDIPISAPFLDSTSAAGAFFLPAFDPSSIFFPGVWWCCSFHYTSRLSFCWRRARADPPDDDEDPAAGKKFSIRFMLSSLRTTGWYNSIETPPLLPTIPPLLAAFLLSVGGGVGGKYTSSSA